MGKQKGEYKFLHPNNHVNCSQSTNDAYPTAFRIALYLKIDEFVAALETVRKAFEKKAATFNHVLKMGRTQLQDAVPMTLGQEFKAFGETLAGASPAAFPLPPTTAVAAEAATGRAASAFNAFVRQV